MSAQQPESARPAATPESARPTATPESARPTTTPESARPTATPESARPTITFYEAVGGEPFFTALVGRFYEGVAGDPELRRLYPEEDLTDAEERLRLFLIQYWGGPTTYGEQRGHPRLRMRHAPFVIGPAERDAWLRHMGDAVDSMDLPPELRAPLWDYLFGAAYAMQNSAG